MAADDDHSIGTREPRHRLRQRFEVIRKLGHGTYGKVQLAVNKETGQEVAIKTIKKAKIENGQDLVRIRREIQIMSYVQHPHIIHIHEVFENKEKIVLVMQYASGGELYDYLKTRRGSSEADSRRIFRQIVSAVYYCHKNKICHRDLKLENILLDERGNAKIADFGLSNVFSDDKFLHTFCGSPLYASPEIVKGKPYYGPEVDCWSLGVLLYTLIYGAMPFDGSNFRSLVRQISEGDYYEPKRKSDASGLIQHLLTVKPAKRATVYDICDHWWVNLGYEHPLLQVAEDMASFSPINVDAFLNLPQTSRNEQCKSPRKQDSRSSNSPIAGHSSFSPESNECKTAKLVSKCLLNDKNYDVINSDSVSCSDDSLIVNNVGPSKDIAIESNVFPSDCFHSVPDKSATYKFSAKIPQKELSTNNIRDKKNFILQPESSGIVNKSLMTEEAPKVRKAVISDVSSHSPETLNKPTNKNDAINNKQTSSNIITSPDNQSSKEKPVGKSEKKEPFILSNQAERTKKETSEEKLTLASNSKHANQENRQSTDKIILLKDNSSPLCENNKTSEMSKTDSSTLKITGNSIQSDKSKLSEKKSTCQPLINKDTKGENETTESCEQENKQSIQETILPSDNSSALCENNKSEISHNDANNSKTSDKSVSTQMDKSGEQKVQPNSETKENRTAEKTKDTQDGKKSPIKRGPGKVVIPKFLETAQTVEKPADNKKIGKPTWAVSDVKKAFESKPQEKKPIYIPTRRVSDARSKFEQKIESHQVSTLPRRASRQSGAIKEDLSASSLSSQKSDQRRGSELDSSSSKDASQSDMQKLTSTQSSCEESKIMQTHKMPEKESEMENDEAKKTSVKSNINDINTDEGNKVAVANPSKDVSGVLPLQEDKSSGNKNSKDISDKEAIEKITEVSPSSVDLESTPIIQNHISNIMPSEQNSSIEKAKQVAHENKNTIDSMEEQHKCNFHEGTMSAVQTMSCDDIKACKKNENIDHKISEHNQDAKTTLSNSTNDKNDHDKEKVTTDDCQMEQTKDDKNDHYKEKVTSDDYQKEQPEEDKNSVQAISNDSGNCSDNEIRPPSKAQTINDQSSGYISENQSLAGGEEQDVNGRTKLDVLKTFMEKECSPLNALLQNGYDHIREVPHNAQYQRPSYSNAILVF